MVKVLKTAHSIYKSRFHGSLVDGGVIGEYIYNHFYTIFTG